MAKFPTYEEMSKKVAEKALDEFLYNGKSIWEWMQIIASQDTVSRQAVKEQMIKYGFHAPDMTVTEFVEDLPSVKPQELKTGHWILKEVRQGKSLVCSECRSDLGSICPTEYCPECGCRMLGVVEEEKYTAESEDKNETDN